MNNGLFAGYLTRDPQLKESEKNKYCNFTIGARRKYKNKEGIYESDFIEIKAWNRNAERLCENTKKGDYISCSAHIESHTYTTDDGKKQYKTEIVADEINYKVKEKKEEIDNNIDKDLEYDRT